MPARSHPDETWTSAIEGLPHDERELRRVLPYRIGVTWRPDGGWGDYVRHEPIHDFVGCVAEVLDDVDPEVSERFRRAHHLAGFSLLVTDRVADGQVVEDEALAGDRAWLRAELVEALAAATGDRRRAETSVAGAEARWRRAVDKEQAAFGARALDPTSLLQPAEYVGIVSGKVAPLWVATEQLLAHQPVAASWRGQLRAWFERTMLVLQLIDDVRDATEDRRRTSSSIPELLGVEHDVFVVAARSLLADLQRRTAEVLPRWTGWVEQLRDAARAIPVAPGRLAAAALGAQALLLSLSVDDDDHSDRLDGELLARFQSPASFEVGPIYEQDKGGA